MTIVADLAGGAAGEISRRWYAKDPDEWFCALRQAQRTGVPLLVTIDERYRGIRDDVAREAFDKQISSADVALRRLMDLSPERAFNRWALWAPPITAKSL